MLNFLNMFTEWRQNLVFGKCLDFKTPFLFLVYACTSPTFWSTAGEAAESLQDLLAKE